MPILVEDDPTTAGVLGSYLPPRSLMVRAGEVEAALARRDDYAVVIGPTLPMEEATELADRIRVSSPTVAIVLVRHDLAPQVYSWAMQVGIGAVVAADDQVALAAALTRARQTWEAIHGPSTREQQVEGRVLTVFSPKGGVGKTTMAVNLGLALASATTRVCIVDLDLAFGDVAITLQLIPDHTIVETADAADTLDYSLLKTLLTVHTSSLMILAAPTHPEGRERIPASLVPRVIQTLRSNFDYVVIDTPPGFDDHVLAALDVTDECVVVATLDVPTIKNTKVALETMDLLDLLRDKRHLVLNRADEEVGLTRANVESILNMQVAMSLPSATAVASATNNGDPIVASKPEHPVSKGIVALAGLLTGENDHAARPAAARAKRGMFGRQKAEKPARPSKASKVEKVEKSKKGEKSRKKQQAPA